MFTIPNPLPPPFLMHRIVITPHTYETTYMNAVMSFFFHPIRRIPSVHREVSIDNFGKKGVMVYTTN